MVVSGHNYAWLLIYLLCIITYDHFLHTPKFLSAGTYVDWLPWLAEQHEVQSPNSYPLHHLHAHSYAQSTGDKSFLSFFWGMHYANGALLIYFMALFETAGANCILEIHKLQ